jgi:hypothetical protein
MYMIFKSRSKRMNFARFPRRYAPLSANTSPSFACTPKDSGASNSR